MLTGPPVEMHRPQAKELAPGDQSTVPGHCLDHVSTLVWRKFDCSIIARRAILKQRSQALLNPDRMLLTDRVHVSMMKNVHELVAQRTSSIGADEQAAFVLVVSVNARII